MAIMIPSIPKNFTPESGEDKVFKALKSLPGDLKNKTNAYYVFHSFKINQVDEEINTDEEHEIDFVIFHPSKGIVCIECKSGEDKNGEDEDYGKALSETVVNITDNVVQPREWYHAKINKNGELVKSSKNPMIEGGPFKQAWNRKQDLIRYISKKNIVLHEWGKEKFKDHCRITYAVCFPKISSANEEYNYNTSPSENRNERHFNVSERTLNYDVYSHNEQQKE